MKSNSSISCEVVFQKHGLELFFWEILACCLEYFFQVLTGNEAAVIYIEVSEECSEFSTIQMSSDLHGSGYELSVVDKSVLFEVDFFQQMSDLLLRYWEAALQHCFF